MKKKINKSELFCSEKGKLLSLYSKYKHSPDKWVLMFTELLNDESLNIQKVPPEVFTNLVVKNIKESIPPNETQRYKPVFSDKKRYESAILMISDVHIGKVNTILDPTNGESKITYNKDIFRKEYETLVESIKQIVGILKNSICIKKLYITFLGDIFDNDRIFSGQQSQLDLSVGKQLWEGVGIFENFINTMLSFFEEVSVSCVVGNHGRTTNRREDEPVTNSFEYTFANILKTIFRGNKRCSFYIPESWWGLISVYGWKYLIHHGDSVYSWGSLPYYGLTRMGKSRRVEFAHNFDLCGHFHQRMEIPISQRTFTLVNGCWISADSYTWKKYGIISKPEQYFFGVNEKRARTWSFNLELEDV